MYDPKEIHLLNPKGDAGLYAANLRDAHLTDEQFTGLLLGSVPSQVSAHLDICGDCSEEAQRVSGAIGSFEQQSRLWAERRASVLPALRSAHQPVLSWLNRPAAWSALAATVVLATVIGVTRQTTPAGSTHQPVQQAVAAIQASPEIPAATLKQDNDLLSAIDGELSADAAPPASMYGLKVETSFPQSRSLKRISN